MNKKVAQSEPCILTSINKFDQHILKLLYENPEGLRMKTINALLPSKRRTLYYHLNKLKKLSLIINIFPIWKIKASCRNLAHLLKGNNIQSHKFSFVVNLIRKPYWWDNRHNKLLKLKDHHFKNVTWGRVKYTQLDRDDYIIQAFPNSIVIINRKQYWGSTPYDCLIDSLNDVLDLISFIEELYKIQLTLDGVPHMNIKSHHYVDINHALALKCKKDKKGFMVEINNEKRVWVDFSIPFGLEYGHKDHATEDYKKLNPFFTDILEMDQAPLMSDLIKMIQVQQEQINSLFYKAPDELNKKDSYFG